MGGLGPDQMTKVTLGELPFGCVGPGLRPGQAAAGRSGFLTRTQSPTQSTGISPFQTQAYSPSVTTSPALTGF